MANPNVTVAQARARKWSLQDEVLIYGFTEAIAKENEWAKSFPDETITRKTIRVGRRGGKRIAYVIRRYKT